MLEPKLKIKNRPMYVSEKYFTNGHWLIAREYLDNRAKLPRDLKVLKSLLDLELGTHDFSQKPSLYTKQTPNIEAVIPSMDGYALQLSKNPVNVHFDDDLRVISYVFDAVVDGQNFQFAINPNFCGLLHMSDTKLYVKTATSPLVLKSGDSIDSPLAILIMPMRL
jgi:hypothetical protein